MQANEPNAWCHSAAKRAFDLLLASAVLIIVAPLLVAIAAAILITSGRPVFFRQKRVGQNGLQFVLLKFRTMKNVGGGPAITQAGDQRITPLGRWLRSTKLDELPQFVNVIRGEMSLVGPRPDLPEFWECADEVSRRALALRPGITGAASLYFRREEEGLAHIPADELLAHYVSVQLPMKASLDCEYAARANFATDCTLLLQTLLPITTKRRQPVGAHSCDSISR